MKSLLKLGSLFALIIAGRYMQSVAPIGAMKQKAPLAFLSPAKPTLTRYVNYSTTVPVLPASQRTQPKPAATIWY